MTGPAGRASAAAAPSRSARAVPQTQSAATTARLVAVFLGVYDPRMRDVPLCSPSLPVEAIGFRPHRGGALGMLAATRGQEARAPLPPVAGPTSRRAAIKLIRATLATHRDRSIRDGASRAPDIRAACAAAPVPAPAPEPARTAQHALSCRRQGGA